MGDFGSPPALGFPALGGDHGFHGGRPHPLESFGTPPAGSRAFLAQAQGFSPRMAGLNQEEGPQVTRRAAEWERQIETLDQKEMEIHQTQLRLIREQTATFRGDLLAVRQELAELRTRFEKFGSLHGDSASRTNQLERGLQDLTDGLGKHGSLFQDVDRKLQQVSNNINEHHRVLQRQATAMEKMDFLEQAVRESADKHARAIDDAHAKVEALTSRHGLSDKAYADLKAAHADKDIKHATLTERVAYLEKFTGETADKHLREIEVTKGAHEQLVKDSFARHAVHDALQPRLAALETQLKESTTKHGGELETLRSAVGGGVTASSTVAQRLAFLEKAVGDSADKHGNTNRELGDRLGKHGESVDSLMRNAQTQNERIVYIEKILSEVADRHRQELDALNATVSKQLGDHQGVSKSHGTLSEKLESVIKSHLSVEDRIAYLERVTGDTIEKHAREITALKSSHTDHAAHGKQLHVKHATIEDRVDYVEKVVGDSAEKHASAINAIQLKHDQLHGKLSDHDKLRSKHEGEITMQRDRLLQHHATIEERLDFLEKAIGESADKHLREMENLKGAHAKVIGEGKEIRVKHGTMEERMDYMETWFRGFKPR